MNLREANETIARFNRGERVSMHEHAAASVFVGSYYTHERPDLCRPLHGSPTDSNYLAEKALAEALPRWRSAGLDVLPVYPWADRRHDKSDVERVDL